MGNDRFGFSALHMTDHVPNDIGVCALAHLRNLGYTLFYAVFSQVFQTGFNGF